MSSTHKKLLKGVVNFSIHLIIKIKLSAKWKYTEERSPKYLYLPWKEWLRKLMTKVLKRPPSQIKKQKIKPKCKSTKSIKNKLRRTLKISLIKLLTSRHCSKFLSKRSNSYIKSEIQKKKTTIWKCKDRKRRSFWSRLTATHNPTTASMKVSPALRKPILRMMGKG